MPCLQVPTVPTPVLPFPFTVSVPTISTPAVGLNLCCNITIPSIPLPLPPLPPFGTGAVAVVEAVSVILGQINSFLGQLSISCPLN